MTTLEQKIAAAETKLARLRDQERRLETGQKVILGGMLLAAARNNLQTCTWVINEAEKLTREADRKRLAPLIAELRDIRGF